MEGPRPKASSGQKDCPGLAYPRSGLLAESSAMRFPAPCSAPANCTTLTPGISDFVDRQALGSSHPRVAHSVALRLDHAGPRPGAPAVSFEIVMGFSKIRCSVVLGVRPVPSATLGAPLGVGPGCPDTHNGNNFLTRVNTFLSCLCKFVRAQILDHLYGKCS